MNTTILTFFLLFTSSTSFAIPVKDSPARQLVETIITKAKDLDNKNVYTANTQYLESQVDFARLTHDALGDNVRRVSATQRSQIQTLLSGIITKSIYPEAPKFFRDVTIEFTDETKGPKGIHITSIVTKGTDRATVEYWLGPATNGSLKVIDLAIDGESWVENLRSQFEELLSKKGATELINRMKQRLREIEKEKRV